MSDYKETTGRTIGDALFHLIEMAGCIAVILIFGTCAGCFTVAGIHKLP